MKKLLILLIALSVSACSALSVTNPINTSQLAIIESGYGVALSAAVAYRNRPLCKNGEHASIINVCSERSVVIQLQKADQVVQVALKNARTFIKDNPNLDPSSALQAVKDSITLFKQIETSYGVSL